MSAVTEQFKMPCRLSAERELESRKFTRTDAGSKLPSQWMNGGHHWATIEKMPSGKFLVKIGVATI